MAQNQNVAVQSGQRQEVARPIDQFKGQLQAALPTMQKLLPAHITREKFEAMVVGAILANPDLLNAERASLMQSVADTADLGLSLNKQMKEADILLVQGKAQMRPRYEGLVKLARQSGEIIDIYAHEVYENDHFSYKLGLDKKLEHWPPEDGSDRGELLQMAYCVWETKDRVKGFEVIGSKRIARAKAASEGFKAFKAGKIKSTPWVTDEAQMIRKTAIRAAGPYMPKSTESDKFQRALAMSDDTSFDDDDHAGVSSETQVIVPRPTKGRAAAQEAKDLAEKTRKDAVAKDTQYRQTMQEDDPKAEASKSSTKPSPEPEHINHDPETGEVDETEPENAEKPTEEVSAMNTAKHAAVDSLLRKKIAAYTTATMISGVLEDYKDELDAMKSDDRPRWNALKAFKDERLAALKKK